MIKQNLDVAIVALLSLFTFYGMYIMLWAITR